MFKGFVPQKNLEDISKFFLQYPKDSFVYTKNYRGLSSSIISEEEYLEAQKPKFVKEGDAKDVSTALQYAAQIQQSMYHPYYGKEKMPLAICAPLKDMETKGYKVQGVRLVQDIPDPVVLLPKNHKNGVEGYLIITAWGDEASDPLVINENQN